VKLREELVNDAAFAELWDRIRYRTRYHVSIDSEKLVADCSQALAGGPLRNVGKPQIKLAVAKVQAGSEEDAFEPVIVTQATLGEVAAAPTQETLLDLVIDELEGGRAPLRLTRRTVLEIVKAAPNLEGAIDNPAHWASVLADTVREHALTQLVEGIKYEKLPEQDWYTLTQLEQKLPTTTLEVDAEPRGLTDVPASVYEWVIYDSIKERDFAQQELAGDERVRAFAKLPDWFVVDTPLGAYTPDWGIAYERRDLDGKAVETLYLVRETKGQAREQLRPLERAKSDCGAAHFELAADVDFRLHDVGKDQLVSSA
jgi:type III restriction enzyme